MLVITHLVNLVIWKRIHFPKNKNATDTSTTSRRLGMVDFYVFTAPVFDSLASINHYTNLIASFENG